jgi:CubicO group peptidase (beta-lactamase class C family)
MELIPQGSTHGLDHTVHSFVTGDDTVQHFRIGESKLAAADHPFAGVGDDIRRTDPFITLEQWEFHTLTGGMRNLSQPRQNRHSAGHDRLTGKHKAERLVGDADQVLLGKNARGGAAPFAEKVQGIIRQTVQGTQIPGTSAVVVAADGTTWIGTEGIANLGTGRAVSKNDRFNIGSTTKAMVAATVLKLVDADQINLNQTLDQYIPEIADQLPHGDRITVRQLLNHTSGLPDVDNIIREQTINTPAFRAKPIRDPKTPASVRRLFRSFKTRSVSYDAIASSPVIAQLNPIEFNYLAKTLTANSTFARQRTTPQDLIQLAYGQPALFKPGKDYQYASINYLLLGEVVEAATGSTLAQQMRKQIFQPLGMRHTVYPPQEQRPGTFARGYEDFDGDGKADDVLRYLNRSQFGFANGGIYSTAADVARFAQGLFQGKLLAPATLKAMLSKGNQDDEIFKYGLGMLYGKIPGIGKVWQHGGDNDGWHARMFYLPQQNITAVVLQNGDDIAQRRNNGSSAFPKLLIDDLIENIVKQVKSR